MQIASIWRPRSSASPSSDSPRCETAASSPRGTPTRTLRASTCCATFGALLAAASRRTRGPGSRERSRWAMRRASSSSRRRSLTPSSVATPAEDVLVGTLEKGSSRVSVAVTRLCRDLDLRRRQHPKEVGRQPAARFPELQPHDLASARIEFPQTRVGLLGNRRARVVALEANPGDVRLGVVVSFDPHGHRLAPSPHGHDPRNERVIAIRVLVGDHETTSDDQPARLALVARPLAVALQQRRLDISTREAKLLRLVERVKRPANGARVCRHKPAE